MTAALASECPIQLVLALHLLHYHSFDEPQRIAQNTRNAFVKGIETPRAVALCEKVKACSSYSSAH